MQRAMQRGAFRPCVRALADSTRARGFPREIGAPCFLPRLTGTWNMFENKVPSMPGNLISLPGNSTFATPLLSPLRHPPLFSTAKTRAVEFSSIKTSTRVFVFSWLVRISRLAFPCAVSFNPRKERERRGGRREKERDV